MAAEVERASVDGGVDRLGESDVVIGAAQAGPLVEHGTEEFLLCEDVAPAGHATGDRPTSAGIAVGVAQPDGLGALHHPDDMVGDRRERDEDLAVGEGLAAAMIATIPPRGHHSTATVTLTEDGTVRAVARLDDPGGIPADSRVRVRSLSPVGEQYLDFQPRSDPGPFLRDGDVVQASVRDLPTSLGATVVAVSDLLDQVDDRALGRVLREVSTGVAGTGQELGRLIDQTDLLLAELDRALPTAESLLRDAGPAASLVVDQRSDLLQLGRSARRAAAFLKSYDPRLRELLAGAPERLEQIDGLVDQARAVLPAFLMAGVDLGRVLERYDPHLRQLLREYAPGLGTVGEVVGESLRVDLVVDQSTRCRYDTERRAPRDIAPRGLQAGGRCPESAPGLQRGAAHAPPPAR